MPSSDSLHQVKMHGRVGRYTRCISGSYDEQTQTTKNCVIQSGHLTNANDDSLVTGKITLFNNSDGDSGSSIMFIQEDRGTTAFACPIYAPYGFKCRIIQDSSASAYGAITWVASS